MFKYGKTPARPGAMKLALSSYIDSTKLPVPPATFGHDAIIDNYQMLANETYGCCVWAGAAHETMMWNREAGRTVTFTDHDVLSDYTAVTGFDPNDPNTDGGTDMVAAAEYRRKTGIRDDEGVRHKVAGYLAIDARRLDELWAATYLFGAVGIGIQMPESTQDQFEKGQPWDVVPGSKIEGGHYVPLVGRQNGLLHVITWGRVQPVTQRFLAEFCDEAIAYVSEESLKNGKSPEGFDKAALLADLAHLHRA